MLRVIHGLAFGTYRWRPPIDLTSPWASWPERNHCMMGAMRAGSLLATLLLASSAFATTNQPGEVETVGGVPFTHRFLATGATSWHYVEGGDPGGEVVV